MRMLTSTIIIGLMLTTSTVTAGSENLGTLAARAIDAYPQFIELHIQVGNTRTHQCREFGNAALVGIQRRLCVGGGFGQQPGFIQ